MKHLFALIFTLIGSMGFAQLCNPLDHDWGNEPFGVSPDPTVGENFVTGYLNIMYNDQVYVKAPTSVSDVDSTFVGIQLAIDSISLDSITYFNGVSDVNISALGMSVTCNNNGDSPNPCMFLAGNAYCGDISGVPNTVGSFPVTIHVTVYFYFFTGQAIAYTFEGYTLDVLSEIAVADLNISQNILTLENYPNPANQSTTMKFDLAKAEMASITVTNLMGKKVLDRTFNARRGENLQIIPTDEFAPGIYLYSVTVGDRKMTKKMLVQH
jgi:hypothetical protein